MEIVKNDMSCSVKDDYVRTSVMTEVVCHTTLFSDFSESGKADIK